MNEFISDNKKLDKNRHRKSRKRQMHWRFKKEVERKEGERERRPKSN